MGTDFPLWTHAKARLAAKSGHKGRLEAQRTERRRRAASLLDPSAAKPFSCLNCKLQHQRPRLCDKNSRLFLRSVKDVLHASPDSDHFRSTLQSVLVTSGCLGDGIRAVSLSPAWRIRPSTRLSCMGRWDHDPVWPSGLLRPLEL